MEKATTISEIELVPVRAKDGLTFFASCVLDDKYFLGNIAVFSKRDGSGFRCVFPTKMLKNGSQLPIFYPLDHDTGQIIETAISAEASNLLIPDDTQNIENTAQKGGNGYGK